MLTWRSMIARRAFFLCQLVSFAQSVDHEEAVAESVVWLDTEGTLEIAHCVPAPEADMASARWQRSW